MDERPMAATNGKKKKKKKRFAYSVIYTYYRELLQMPALEPWAFFALQCYAPIKIIGLKIIRSIKSEKSLRLMVHISKTLKIKCPR